MLFIILSVLLTLIFMVLAIIHFYWAFGGRWGFEAALPTNLTGKKVLNPRSIHSLLVGVGLSVFVCFYLLLVIFPEIVIHVWRINSVAWVIPSIFLLRAVGDFKYVGFFKKIKTTQFAKMDNQLYSPLCTLIAFLGFTIQLIGLLKPIS